MGCSSTPFTKNIAEAWVNLMAYGVQLNWILSFLHICLLFDWCLCYGSVIKWLYKLITYLFSTCHYGPMYLFSAMLSSLLFPTLSLGSFTILYCYLGTIISTIKVLPSILQYCIWFSSLKPQPRCKFKPKSPPAVSWESEEDYFPYWRYLHLLGEPVLDEFDELCQNEDFWSLARPDANLLSTATSTSPYSVIQPFLFSLSDNEATVLDLTRILKTTDLVRFQSVYNFKSANGLPLIFDTGASITVTPHLRDFINGKITTENLPFTHLNGVNSSHIIKGMGTMRVLVYTDTNQPRYIETTAYYVPDINVRLLSVQRYIDENPNQDVLFSLCDKGMRFTFPTSTGGGSLTFRYRETHHLPIAHTFSSSSTSAPSPSQQRTIQVLDDRNLNLNPAQRALLRIHVCLGHFNLQWIQKLLRQNLITNKDSALASQADPSTCLCMGCQFAKQTRHPDGVAHTQIHPEKDGGLKDGDLRPGSRISTDQFVSSVPGRLATSFGKEREEDKLVGGTIFVDHASGYFFVQNQVSLSAPETIRSKHRFERHAIQGGVPILGYRGDNGIYRSQEFRTDLANSQQVIEFSAVGAHHQNGIAERAIRTISDSARAMLIHAMIHWPHETSLDLWPFAVEYAVFLYNHMPRRDSLRSPVELFFDSSHDVASVLSAAKCWGCPAYVLEPTLQDGRKLPRWSPRSKLGQFLGRSREHADAVGRIRNIRTNAISAQFHVVYDNYFTTVHSDLHHDNIPVPYGFDDLLRYSTENAYHPDDVADSRRQRTQRMLDSLPSPSFPPQRENTPTMHPSKVRFDLSRDQLLPLEPPSALREPSSALREPSSSMRQPSSSPLSKSSLREQSIFPPESSLEPVSPSMPSLPLHDESSHSDFDPDSSSDTPSPPIRRSQRVTKGQRATRYSEEHQGDSYAAFLPPHWGLSFYDAFLVDTDLTSKRDSLTRQFDTLHLWRLDQDDESISLGVHPLAFAAKANAEDTPRWHEVMKSPDRDGFIKAMHVEWDQLECMDAWNIVPRSKALQEGRRIIDSTWAFRRKRYPDGEVKKLKARLCVRGDQMLDLNPFDTYSPVVAWSTIRLMLIMAVILDLQTTQVDYTNAFVQAKAAPGTYIEMPKMFEQPGFILELKRNLYGQRDAPVRFFEHLKTGLEQRNFSQSVNDRCLFISNDVIVLTYVDDCIFFSRSKAKIDKLIHNLREPKNKSHIAFTLNVESDYEGFLGIDIRPSQIESNALELLQIGLIDRILAALNLENDDTATRNEPASATTLGKDESGPPRKEFWSYASVIGMLLYLASNSRPDIAFAVHQCARFSHCARACHEQAVKRIARYLKKTRDRGLLMKPNTLLNLEMYADADFAGLWNAEEPHDPVCVKSRTGYIIYLSDVPVLWSSKLQTEIATSTMHAEYIALSSGMRELIPVRNVFHDVCQGLNLSLPESAKILRVFEDNEGAQKLASSPVTRTTPHSKHFAIKYHWFREKLDEYNISILRVDTSRQKADIFTKGLVGKEFTEKRLLLMGW